MKCLICDTIHFTQNINQLKTLDKSDNRYNVGFSFIVDKNFLSFFWLPNLVKTEKHKAKNIRIVVRTIKILINLIDVQLGFFYTIFSGSE